MSSGGDKRQRAMSVMAAKMRREGRSLGEIAAATGINRQSVAKRIELGERLLTLDDPIRATEGHK